MKWSHMRRVSRSDDRVRTEAQPEWEEGWRGLRLCAAQALFREVYPPWSPRGPLPS